MRDYDKTIEECKKNFAKHVLTVICDHERVKRFQFRRPDSGMYGFSLTTADNLIVMNGDTYALMLEPGYGRQGLGWLRGSVDSVSYLLEKCPFRKLLTEYSYEQAKENLQYYVTEEYLKQEDVDDLYGLDDGELYSEGRYYEFCHEKEIDEPMSPRRLTYTTLNQVAGLQCFVEAYEKYELQEEARWQRKIKRSMKKGLKFVTDVLWPSKPRQKRLLPRLRSLWTRHS
jgi:hypothetical protein